MTLATQIASDLLDIKAVYLKPEEPFTWASGIKSPIYTDNRITLSYPETRTLIENGFVEKIKEEFPDVTIIRPMNQIIKTERIRELVGQFSQSGIENQRQVFIIEQAEKMHVNAANSLLKVIEEPQSEIYIFFLFYINIAH